VGIRGIVPDLNTTSINGLRIPAPEGDKRAIQLDVLPSELLSSLEVTKSVTPDMDGDAVGGSIDIRSISAFDRRSQTMSFTAESTYSDLTDEASPRVSGNFTRVFDVAGLPESLGVAAAISHYDRDFGSDNVENGDGWPSDRERLDGTEFRGAEAIEQREYTLNRERFGAALNVDFRPSDYAEYYLRTLYSEASDQEYRMANVLNFEDDDADNGGARNDSTGASATWDNAELEKQLKDRYEEAIIISIAAGGSHLLEAWMVEYQVGYSWAEQDTPSDRTALFAGSGYTLGYGGLGQQIGAFGDPGTADAAGYELDEISLAESLTEDEEWITGQGGCSPACEQVPQPPAQRRQRGGHDGRRYPGERVPDRHAPVVHQEPAGAEQAAVVSELQHGLIGPASLKQIFDEPRQRQHRRATAASQRQGEQHESQDPVHER
jgi:TonB-dependent receptor